MRESNRESDRREVKDPAFSNEPLTETAGNTEGAGPVRRNGETRGADEETARLKEECDTLKDQALRARAEFANYQKRAKQQAEADRVYAVGSLARDLLDSIDNLSRAIDSLRATGFQ